MFVGQTGNTPQVGAITPAGPAVAPSGAEPTASQSLAAANQLTAAPAASATKGPNALDVMPKDWIPMGHTERHFSAKLGPIQVASGTAQIDRGDDTASIKTPQGNFSFKTDPGDPNDITATTPAGTFTGTGVRTGNDLKFMANDHKHGLNIQNSDKGLRVDTHGFGALDKGHLEVSGH